MYGSFLIVKEVTGLHSHAGARQLAKCDVALYHGNDGQLSSEITALLGSETTQ